MFKKASLSRGILVGFLLISCGVGLIAKVAGPDKAAIATHTAVGIAAFGVGTTGSAIVDETPAGLQMGWNAHKVPAGSFLPSQVEAPKAKAKAKAKAPKP